MAELLVAYDSAQPVGERLAPEVQAEVAALAPSTVDNGSITTAKLADDAVTTAKLAPGAVTSIEIATGGVATANLAADAVSTAKLADGAVTAAKAGLGVAKAYDAAGNPISLKVVPITAAAFGAITPDPGTAYLISD